MWYYKLCIFTLLILSSLLVGCQSPEASPTAVPVQEQPDVQDSEPPPTATTAVQEELAEPWKVVKQIKVDHLPGFTYFANPEFGITACNRGETDPPHPRYTTDGGQTWNKSGHAQSSCPIGVYIIDTQSIWTCNDIDEWFVQDGFQSWNEITRPAGEGCRLLSFADNENGWAVAATTELVATSDGGASWQEITMPDEIQEIASISLRTPENGYVLDFDRTLYETHDGGTSWSAQTLELEDSELEFMSMGASAAAIHFTDEDNGVVVLNAAGGGNSALVALHTTDGGQTWEPIDLPVDLGSVFLSHDGTYLTVNVPGKDTVLLERGATVENGN